ncbi:hypothetical protein GCM10027285_13240 [Oleiagrimonas citrea]
MFDHVVFGTSDYATSRAFFLKALEPIGIAIVSEGPLGIELSTDGKSSLCIRRIEERPAHLHLAFTAKNRQQVEAFHRAALEAGARDHGPLDSARSTAGNTMPRSSSDRTGTTSKWCATRPRTDAGSG